MFERFTERARQVVVLAQDEARALGHNSIGTEHLLLGLLREGEGVGAHALGSFDVTLARTQEEVERIVGRGTEVTSGQIPFTPRAKKVLELSLREAMSLGAEYIDTEHVLLGLLREGGGVGARILDEFGCGSDAVRAHILGLSATILARPARRSRPKRRPRRELSEAQRSVELRSSLVRPCEYRVVEVERLEEEQLNELGAEGWQLVAVTGADPYRLVFMRWFQGRLGKRPDVP